MLTTSFDQRLKEVSISLNDIVKVRLTDVGRRLYAIHHPDGGAMPFATASKGRDLEDGDGYVSFQLYELMEIFGRFFPSVPPTGNEHRLFVDDEIIFDPNLLNDSSEESA